MGEAKRRAERHRDAAAAQPYDREASPQYTEVVVIMPRRLATQLRARHEFVRKQFAGFYDFVTALIEAGVEVFDRDIAAFEAHARGDSKPVAPPPPEPERLVVTPSEANPAAIRTLAQMHEAAMAAGGSK